MDGVLNVYKEKGMTSFDVIRKLRPVLRTKKLGHTGTLDPDATGVLPVCIGKATRIVDLLIQTDKIYKAEMLLGKKTDTQDISGKVLSEMSEDEIFDVLSIEKDKKALLDAFMPVFEKFTGELKQIPPMYSAIKIDGVKLINAARRGENIERKPRDIEVYEYKNISISDDLKHISFEINCSKGTYVRTLCEDMGAFNNIPACLSSLERISAAGLTVDESLTLSEIKELSQNGMLEEKLTPIDDFFFYYSKRIITDEAKKKIIHGNYLNVHDLKTGKLDKGMFRIYDGDGKFYALYKYDVKKRCLVPEKMFI